MNRRDFLTKATVLSVALWVGCTDKKSTSSAMAPKDQGYWTCTMHPQVHMDAPGKCPICGMPLVHVDGNHKIEKKEPEAIDASNSQLQNAQVTKYKVARKDLDVSIPVSGRMLSSREVVFQIYESDLASVKAGLEFTGSPSGAPGKTFIGRITHVDTLVDPSSRTVRAVGALQASAPVMTAESAFHGEIFNQLKNQIVVPEEAVLHAGTRELVYVFSSDNKLTPREVELGQKGKNAYQILSGLSEGEVISSGPNFLIDSEAKIRGL